MKEHKQTLPVLIAQAKLAFNNAYAPYSQFKVGASAMTSSGQVVIGCNVENASYGLTVCAERNCIAQAVVTGQTRFNHLVIYTEQDRLTPPCGACRQVIAEFFNIDALVTAVNHLGKQHTWQVNALLPDAFTPDFLKG
jgi:cytidine deaminase